jgi:hypothetical protein
MKVCRRCKFLNTFGLCKEAANIGISVVTGMPFGAAKNPEKMRNCEAYCGSSGRWFESKSMGNVK